MKTNSSRKWVLAAQLMEAAVLASEPGAQAQSAADVQNANGMRRFESKGS